jgi:type IV pilus assembly protein PilX
MRTERTFLLVSPPGGHARQQAGISLVIVLVFLVILSILGVTGMQNATFASRIAGNEADRTLAFQAAEAALRDAENDIRGLNYDSNVPANCTACRTDLISRGNGFSTACSLGRCVQSGATQLWEDSTIWDSSSTRSVTYGTYTNAPALQVVVRQPRYILEYFDQGGFAVYRITAMGFGANDSTRALLQSAVKVKAV